MSVMPIINLFNAYDLQSDPYEADKINCQEVVDYCEARFRVALQAMVDVIEEDKIWMTKTLFRELECCFSYIGVAAAIGQSVNIPIVVRTLSHDLYQFGFMPNTGFSPGLDLLVFLDGDLCSFGEDHPSLLVEDFHVPWWRSSSPPIKYTSYLSFATLKTALAKHREFLRDVSPANSLPNPAAFHDVLNKPAYSWHPDVRTDLDNPCTRCRLYRAVALGTMDKMRDLHNWVNACEMANVGEKEVSMRRASGFNELYEAAMQKEIDSGSALASDRVESYPIPVVPGRSGDLSPHKLSKRVKGNKKASEVAEDVRRRAEALWMNAGRPDTKWTWGVNLTSEDLRGFVRGADRQYQLPHSGYDESLKTGKLGGFKSPIPNPINFESDGIFEELSPDFPGIRDLNPDEIPLAFAFAPLHHSAEWESGPELDPELIKGFRGQILKTNDSDVLSIVSDNASVVPMESPPCRSWLGPPPLVPLPSSEPLPSPSPVHGPHAGSGLIPEPDDEPEDEAPLGGPLFPIYIPSGNSSSSASNQEKHPMDMSEDSHSTLSYAMDVVTSDDLLIFPIGDLDLAESGPIHSGAIESGPIESVFMEPLTSGMLGNLETQNDSSILTAGDRYIAPLTVYMSDSDPEDIGVRSGLVRAPSSSSLPGRYTAASFANVPDEWLA